MLIRPRPPEDLLGQEGFDTATPVRPDHDLLAWIRATFIDEDALLLNEDHAHLRSARLGALWCAVPNARQGNSVVGMCETTAFMGNRWAKARFEQQITGWFGFMPHFLLTFDAGYADQCDDATFCSLVEHELYHAGQAKDVWGAPRFNNNTGEPVFEIRGHDVEEFVGVVARYGVGAAAGKTAARSICLAVRARWRSSASSRACPTSSFLRSGLRRIAMLRSTLHSHPIGSARSEP